MIVQVGDLKDLKYNYDYSRGTGIEMRNEQRDVKIKSQAFLNLWYERIYMLVSHAYTKTLRVSLMTINTEVYKVSQE